MASFWNELPLQTSWHAKNKQSCLNKQRHCRLLFARQSFSPTLSTEKWSLRCLLEAIAARVETIATRFLLLIGWRPLLLVCSFRSMLRSSHHPFGCTSTIGSGCVSVSVRRQPITAGKQQRTQWRLWGVSSSLWLIMSSCNRLSNLVHRSANMKTAKKICKSKMVGHPLPKMELSRCLIAQKDSLGAFIVLCSNHPKRAACQLLASFAQCGRLLTELLRESLNVSDESSPTCFTLQTRNHHGTSNNQLEQRFFL